MKLLSLLFLSLLLVCGCATRPPEYQVSHILCATEAQATRAIARVHAGETFESVAADMSQDPGTRANGGRIVFWTKADDWSANFAAEVKRLKVGEMSDRPIKTEFGWHVVRVDAVR